jgi:DNA polymerase V
LKLYKKTDYELAEEILKEITKQTGLTATCGIGPNILLAKIAMDTEAKKYKNGIAKWTEEDVEKKLWKITPLSKMWSIGPRMEKRLNALGIYSVGDLALTSKNYLKDKFGVMGEELWLHANGIDNSVISKLDKHPKDKSYSNSQVLFKDYNGNNVRIIIEEMVDTVIRRVRLANKQTQIVGLAIGYSKTSGGGFYRTLKLENPTQDTKIVLDTCLMLFDRYYTNKPIRKVGVSLGGLVDKTNRQLNLFTDYVEEEKEEKKNKAIDEITHKYGKNSIFRASYLLSDSTIKERNKKRGGHSE